MNGFLHVVRIATVKLRSGSPYGSPSEPYRMQFLNRRTCNSWDTCTCWDRTDAVLSTSLRSADVLSHTSVALFRAGVCHCFGKAASQPRGGSGARVARLQPFGKTLRRRLATPCSSHRERLTR